MDLTNIQSSSPQAQINLGQSLTALSTGMTRYSSGCKAASAAQQAGDLAMRDSVTASDLSLVRRGQTASIAFSMAQTAEGALSDDINGMHLGLGRTDISGETGENAQASISAVDDALRTVETSRSKLGNAMSDLNISTQKNAASQITNLEASNSRWDVDTAEETAALAKHQILSQRGAAMLTQANQSPQLALGLLY